MRRACVALGVLAAALGWAAFAAVAQPGGVAVDQKVLDVSGKMLDVSGKVLDVSGKVLDVSGKVLDISGRVLDISGRVLDISGQILSMQVIETPKETRIELPADILFDFDKFDLRKSAEPALKQAGDVLRRGARGPVTIDGHTDSKGAPAYNQKLSEQRAESVRKWLVEREGLAKIKFVAKGFGATKPAAPNANADGSDNPEGRQKNRRVEITFKKG